MKTIDVILISYNQEQYIRQAMESILMQEMLEGWQMHLIVADDKSTDKTATIIREVLAAADYKHAVEILETETNLGMHKNYKRAYAACKGELVAVLEGDDYWVSPKHLKQHIEFLSEHAECSMSMNNIILLDSSNDSMHLHRTMVEEYQYVDLYRQITKGNHLGNLSACVFRTKYIEMIPEKMHEIGFADWLLGMWMAQYGLIGILKEVTSVYRKNPQGLWTKLSEEEQHKALMNDSDQYDELFNHQYHSYFEEFRASIQRQNQAQRKYTWKSFIPPIIYQWIKKTKKY